MSEHGTNAGYQRHRRAGEDACDACRKANTERSYQIELAHLEQEEQ